jgi:hypothetical protein
MVFYSRALLLGRLLSLVATAFLAASALADSSLSSGEAPSQPDTSEESRFLSENDAAMNKMMAGMQIKPSRDVDRDFVDIMVPHHQGAIDMAQAVLRYGRNEQIRRLAQEIIVTQQQEIAAMRFAIGDPLPASMASPTQTQPVEGAEQMGGALSTSQRSMFRHHMQTRD